MQHTTFSCSAVETVLHSCSAVLSGNLQRIYQSCALHVECGHLDIQAYPQPSALAFLEEMQDMVLQYSIGHCLYTCSCLSSLDCLMASTYSKHQG